MSSLYNLVTRYVLLFRIKSKMMSVRCLKTQGFEGNVKISIDIYAHKKYNKHIILSK